MTNRIFLGISLALIVIIGGTIGYMGIEGWSFVDSLYMTIISVTTVGYGEVRPLTQTGRVFTIALLFVGVGSIFYILGTLAELVVEGKLRKMMGRRSLQRHIRSLKEHYIVCGYGRIGSQVTQMLLESGVQVVVVDSHQEVTQRLESEGIYYILGSATEDEVLLSAGIERAAGLVATVSSDADNVYIVLSARGIRPDLFIIGRATEAGGERKLKRAGADKVVSPYFIGARRMAQMVLRPSVADFIDLTFHSSEVALQMEELYVGPRAEIAEKSLIESNIRQTLDIIVMAIKRPDGQMLFNPPANTVVNVGDTLIALGPRTSMTKLGRILGE